MIAVWILLLRSEDTPDILSQNFAKLNTPLIETVDVIQESLNRNSVLIEGQKLTAFCSVQRTLEKKGETWSITDEKLVLMELFWNTLSLQLINGLSEGQSVWLGEEVRHELVMV